MSVSEMYERRFKDDRAYRTRVWKVLCSDFFQRYVPEDSVLLDVGAGYCEFVNNIKAGKRIAVDLNPDTRASAADGVDVISASCTDMAAISDETVDVAFVSNLFEHLSREDIVKAIREVRRVLKKDGTFLILQPNIRFCATDYWMFFDHITPIDDRSLVEVLELNGFAIEECRPRFLPFSTKGWLPRPPSSLISLYVKLPFLHRFLGAQAFIRARTDARRLTCEGKP